MSRNSEKIGRNRQTHQRIALKNIILIIVLLVGILALGLFFCERGLSKWIDGEKRSVSEISDLKLQRLVDWSEARLKTRGLLFQGAALSNVLSEWLLKPNVPPSASLVDRLEAYSSARDIAALFILNSNKELLFNTHPVRECNSKTNTRCEAFEYLHSERKDSVVLTEDREK